LLNPGKFEIQGKIGIFQGLAIWFVICANSLLCTFSFVKLFSENPKNSAEKLNSVYLTIEN